MPMTPCFDNFAGMSIASWCAFLIFFFTGSELLFAGESQNHYRVALSELANDFKSARTLPAGSRPSPPDLDLKSLPGLSSTRLRSSLGPPDHPIHGYRPQCGADLCWVFTYGPKESFAPSVIKQENGLNTIEVTTGGPFLLVVGVLSNRVATVKWEGQK
jgi:hypothetical protein